MWEAIDLRELRVFLTPAEELHFGRNGERLRLTPSRVSQISASSRQAWSSAGPPHEPPRSTHLLRRAVPRSGRPCLVWAATRSSGPKARTDAAFAGTSVAPHAMCEVQRSCKPGAFDACVLLPPKDYPAGSNPARGGLRAKRRLMRWTTAVPVLERGLRRPPTSAAVRFKIQERGRSGGPFVRLRGFDRPQPELVRVADDGGVRLVGI
jgi:hypothetical protein